MRAPRRLLYRQRIVDPSLLVVQRSDTHSPQRPASPGASVAPNETVACSGSAGKPSVEPRVSTRIRRARPRDRRSSITASTCPRARIGKQSGGVPAPSHWPETLR